MEPWFAWWRLLLFEKKVGWWSWTLSKTLLLMTVWILLFLKDHVLYFLRLVCISFPIQKLTNFRGSKRKKKLSWKKKWNENLTSFLHLRTQMVVLELIWIGLASCVMIDIKHQKKGKFMLKEHFWGSKLLKKTDCLNRRKVFLMPGKFYKKHCFETLVSVGSLLSLSNLLKILCKTILVWPHLKLTIATDETLKQVGTWNKGDIYTGSLFLAQLFFSFRLSK